MSNPHDPNSNKPQEQPPQSTEQAAVEHSTFEFVLPEGAQSYSDIPPVPQPEEADSTFVNKAAVPPRPNTLRPAANTFDFLALPEAEMGPLSGPGLPEVSASPASSEPPGQLPATSDSTVGLGPASDADPTTFQLGGSGLDLGAMPNPADLLPEPPSSQRSVPDIATLFPPERPAASSSDSEVSLLNPGSMPEMDLPPVEGGSQDFVPPPSLSSGRDDSSLASAEPLSQDRTTTPTPIGEWLLPEEPAPSSEPSAPVPATSGWPEPTAAPGDGAVVISSNAGRSSGDFELPESPITTAETGSSPAAVPPSLPATSPTGSFEGIYHPEASAPGAGSPTPGEGAAASASPVAPVADWIAAEAASEPLLSPVVESSDIFSGGHVPAAEPVEPSDVIAATAYGMSRSDLARPSEFIHPPQAAAAADASVPEAMGSETGSSELPIGREAGSSLEFALPVADSTSIHDLPDPQSRDPLFDSDDSQSVPPASDAPDYGQAPVETEAASSILADLSHPDFTADSGSAVRPSGDGGHGPMFELTVPESPLPAGLFEDSAEELSPEMTSSSAQPTSDLFAPPPSQPEISLGGTPDSEHPSQSSIFSSAPAQDEPSDLHQGEPPVPAVDWVSGDSSDAVEFTDAPHLSETVERDPHGASASPPQPGPRLPYGLSSSDFELSADVADSAEAPVASPQEGSLTELMKSLADDSSESPTKDSRALPEQPVDATSEPVVTVDWMAGSAEGSALHDPSRTDPEFGSRTFAQPVPKLTRSAGDTTAPPVVTRTSPRRPDSTTGTAEELTARDDSSATADKLTPRPTRAKSGSGLVLGGVLGGVLASVACAAIYLSGLVPNQERVSNSGPPSPPQMPMPPLPPGLPTPPGAPTTPTVDAKTAFALGDWTKALELARNADTVEAKAIAGRIRVYAKIHGTATDDDFQQAQADLRDVIDAAEKDHSPEMLQRAIQATVDLGISYEATGNTEAAKKLFTEAKEKFKDHAAIFDALLDRLAAPPNAAGSSLHAPRSTPQELTSIALAVSLLLQDNNPKPPADGEPGLYFWKAIKLARERHYKEAVELIDQAKAAHQRRAKAFAGRGLNPLTDPLEQMFPTACEELAAVWKELYRQPALAEAIQKDGLGKVLNTLASAKTEAMKAQADAKLALDQLATAKDELKKTHDELKKATTLLERTTTELKKTQDNLTTANDKLKKLETDLTNTAKELTQTKNSLKKLEMEKAQLTESELALRKELQTTTAEKTTALTELTKLNKDLGQIAAALAPAVKLPEKWTTADIANAVKNLAALANDKEVKTLLERLTKAETDAKAATDKLTRETQRLTEQYETKLKNLTATHTAEIKTLKDNYNTQITKLQDSHAAEVKKLTEKYTADTQKILREQQLTIQKLTEEHATALKAVEAKLEAEKKAAAVKVATIEKQLANVITPSQAIDLWLPVLTDLRRPTDAASALEIAKRSLASSLPDSEEAAKARTLQGMAFLLKGQYAQAKDEFLAARRSPAFAQDKPWAQVVENGLQAIDDPLALYRQPVVAPAVDSKLAARALDAGIAAYRAGRYPAAEQALLEAAKNDPADPVAWYYLGAARWAMGQTEQARKDFQQGAEREKVSHRPARLISLAIAPIQGDVRDQLDRVRP